MSKDNIQKEIDLAIIEYLSRKGYKDSYLTFREESGMNVEIPIGDDGKDILLETPKLAMFLERKWNATLKLQKKLLETETKLKALETLGTSARTGLTTHNLLPKGSPINTLDGHRGSVTHLVFHPTYPVLFSASEDSTIRIWDYETGEYERSLKGHTKAVNKLAVSPNKGALLASCSNDLSIKLWDINNDYQCVKTMLGHNHSVSSIAFTPSGDHLISCSRDETIKVWDVTTGYCIKTFSGTNKWVRDIQTSLDNSLIASCGDDQLVRIWDPSNGECKTLLGGHNNVVETILFLPSSSYPFIQELCELKSIPTKEGQYVLSASRDKEIILHDIQGQLLYRLKGHDNWVRSLTLSANSQYLISSADDKVIKVWDLKTGRCIRTLMGHDHFVTSVKLDPKGRIMATASADMTVRLWRCS